LRRTIPVAVISYDLLMSFSFWEIAIVLGIGLLLGGLVGLYMVLTRRKGWM
jgi:hypothetical protein